MPAEQERCEAIEMFELFGDALTVNRAIVLVSLTLLSLMARLGFVRLIGLGNMNMCRVCSSWHWHCHRKCSIALPVRPISNIVTDDMI